MAADNDEYFLMDVLNDLMAEIHEVKEEISKAIDDENIHDILTGAHKIKGSAAYLSCRKMNKICTEMCNIARPGSNISNKAEDIKRIKVVFNSYLVAHIELCDFVDSIKSGK